MATQAAIQNRAADLQRRVVKSAEALAVATGIDLPPTFPYVRDDAFRANDQMEWACKVIEAATAAIEQKRGAENG